MTITSIFLLPVRETIVEYFGYLWAFMGSYTIYVIIFFVLLAGLYFFKFIIRILRLK